MKLIVGLGNPGKQYEKTRHNVGFIAIDNYLGEVKWQQHKDALLFDKKIGREKIIFLKPQEYMNLSGFAVRKYLDYYKIPLKNLLVIYDDFSLNVGTYKIKNVSSSGGHNGAQSIIDSLNTNEFSRIKIGISSPSEIETKDYVLGKLKKEDLNQINSLCINEINPKINEFIKKGFN